MIQQFRLDGQVAVVTGGSRGIGRAIAEGLATAGATVLPAARSREDVERVVKHIEDSGGSAVATTVDVTDPNSVDALFETAVEAGGVDCVVNNAGVNPDSALGPPEAVEPEGYDAVADVNLRGAFLCASAAGEYLRENGSLVNIASVGGLVGLPRQHPYVASKHGLVGLTRSLALDWAPDRRVNCVAPGYVATDLTESLRDDDQLRTSIIDRTPLERFADPEEVAGPVVFLASEAASYVTGATLAVDGGWTAR